MNQPNDFETYNMGTSIFQRVYGEKSSDAISSVTAEIKRLESLMSYFIPASEISQLNASAGISSIPVSQDVFEVIGKAKYYSWLSDGTFDITSGPLISLWGIFTKNERLPSDEEISKTLSLINYNDILINEHENTIMLARSGQRVDLGGIAKGYAADRAISIYKQHSVSSAFINLGGNVMTLGSKPDGSPWKIGLQNPFGPRGEYIGIIEACNKSVVTSGDYVRFFEKNDTRFHHILNPKTGYPAESGVISATVISDRSMDADALSTALFIMGVEKGMELVESLNDIEAIFVTKGKKVISSKGAKNSLRLI